MTAKFVKGKGWCRYYRVVETGKRSTADRIERRVLSPSFEDTWERSSATRVEVTAPSGELVVWEWNRTDPHFKIVEDTRRKEPA